MSVSKIITLAAIFATALASPVENGGWGGGETEPTGGEQWPEPQHYPHHPHHPHHPQQPPPSYSNGNELCGNGDKISCCNKSTKDQGGLHLLDGLELIGNCDPISVGLLDLAGILKNECTNQVACCHDHNTELIGLECTSLNL